MPYPKEFSPILFILLVAVCAYLLVTGKLSGTNFIWSIPCCAFSVVAIHNLDVIQQFKLKGASFEATADFRHIRDEVFAEAADVRSLTEQLAELITETSTTSGGYGGVADNPAQQMRFRNKLRQTLEKAKSSQARVKEILAPYETSIPTDLRPEITQAVFNLVQQKHGMTVPQMNEFGAKVKATLEAGQPNEGLNGTVHLLHEAHLSSPELDEAINRYRTYLTEDLIVPLTHARQ